MQPTRFGRRARALLGALLLTAALPATVGAAHPNPTTPYLSLLVPGTVVPLINSGDSFDGTTFQGIPDGIGAAPVGDGTEWVDLYVNHEQSHVPFGGFADFEDSSVSRVRLDLATKQVVELEVALSPSLGFIRFCSSFMAGPNEGFSRYTLFTNEESNDWLTVPAGAPYGSDPSIAPYRQAGYSVLLDPATGSVQTQTRAGRINHENLVFAPGGWKGFAGFTGDDTFTAPGSQLYVYTAANEAQVRDDKGQLWAFQVTSKNGVAVDPWDPFNDANDYLEISGSDTVAGRFIHVPNDIARGTTDGVPQDALEAWSNANNVFQFVRIEDLDYDPLHPNVVYFADTGTSRLAESATTGRLERLATGGTTSNGRVFKMVVNPSDPRTVTSLSILADSSVIPFRNPDNIDVGSNSIMVQEDQSNGNNAMWRFDRTTSAWTKIATVVSPVGESTGVLDMSEWLGAGWWALNVQSHQTVGSPAGPFTYTHPSTGITDTYMKRLDGGQLMLMHIDGS